MYITFHNFKENILLFKYFVAVAGPFVDTCCENRFHSPNILKSIHIPYGLDKYFHTSANRRQPFQHMIYKWSLLRLCFDFLKKCPNPMVSIWSGRPPRANLHTSVSPWQPFRRSLIDLHPHSVHLWCKHHHHQPHHHHHNQLNYPPWTKLLLLI